ncbi:hypothetical protein DYY67_1979 [Candidatus Nitrosotalea sp. TS]|nr:hypothetical protein [Candidatus Nitrosotalea sp. TS]
MSNVCIWIRKQPHIPVSPTPLKKMQRYLEGKDTKKQNLP